MSNIPQISKYSSYQQLSHHQPSTTANNGNNQFGGGSNMSAGGQKPVLNARFHSNPELNLSSGERKNLDLLDLNDQAALDMIEKDILAKLLNRIQS